MGREKRCLHGVLGVLETTEAVPGKPQQFTRVLLVQGSRQRALGLRASPTPQGYGDGHGISVDASFAEF